MDRLRSNNGIGILRLIMVALIKAAETLNGPVPVQLYKVRSGVPITANLVNVAAHRSNGRQPNKVKSDTGGYMTPLAEELNQHDIGGWFCRSKLRTDTRDGMAMDWLNTMVRVNGARRLAASSDTPNDTTAGKKHNDCPHDNVRLLQ